MAHTQLPSDHKGKAVCIDSVCHSYDDPRTGGKKVVLADIDLMVTRGEFVSLVGPSGCGKSTLLRLIIGQELVQSAKCFDVFGSPVGVPDCRRGVVFQQYTLQPHLTVFQNVKLGLLLQVPFRKLVSPQWHKEVKATVEKYLKKMRLEGTAHKYPHELSGGMRQRVAIAQTLVTVEQFGMPQILCMDEPFGALDPGTREEMQVFLLSLWEQHKMTVIFVTHDLSEAVFLASRVIVLSPFWRSDYEDVGQGSRIVVDLSLSALAQSTAIKQSPDFAKTVRSILDRGFDPAKRQHVNEFNLHHPDALITA